MQMPPFLEHTNGLDRPRGNGAGLGLHASINLLNFLNVAVAASILQQPLIQADKPGSRQDNVSYD